MAAPLLYSRWGTKVDKRLFSVTALAACATAGAALLVVGAFSPWAFFALFALFAMVNTALRPFVTNLIFDQHAGDNGALASVLGISNTLMGSLGMVLASLPTDNRVGLLGGLITVCGAVSLAGWLWLLGSRIKLEGMERR